jgi:hypothetical protein
MILVFIVVKVKQFLSVWHQQEKNKVWHIRW